MDKSIQELEYEIKCLAPAGGAISAGLLATAISNSNQRIRSNGLSSMEIVLRRQNISSEPLNFDDKHLQSSRYNKRLQNHGYSEKCKYKGKDLVSTPHVTKGNIVHLKAERRF